MDKKPQEKDRMQDIISMAKRRGYVFPSSEIYGGLNAVFDYGPLGVELKNNVKRAWWDAMTRMRDDVVGLDASILMARRVWQASGHEEVFTDPLVDCRSCKGRFRADHVIEQLGSLDVCPNCGERGTLTEPRPFNLMFKTYMGPVEEEPTWSTCARRRPRASSSTSSTPRRRRKRLPFGIAQIGKAFRNEITPGNFIFRTREFEQMEMQFFIRPEQEDQWFNYWNEQRRQWYLDLGMNPAHITWHEHAKDELAHYARAAVDVDFEFPFGWARDRGHRTTAPTTTCAGTRSTAARDMAYFDDLDEARATCRTSSRPPSASTARPWPSSATPTTRSEVNGETRVVLRLSPASRPVKVAVMPLCKKEDLVTLAHKVHASVRPLGLTQYDDTGGSIGKRYRRQDEIGTPFCVTVDFDSLEDQAVTIRDRDSMAQRRVPIADLRAILAAELAK